MQNPSHTPLERIAASLSLHLPEVAAECSAAGPLPAPVDPRSCAAVALVVRPAEAEPEPELLLIKRATAAGDPWSGHMALPGGRRAPGDSGSYQTAVRETLEEVGLDLARIGRLLGRLDDVRPGSGAPRVIVSPFVFAVPADAEVRLNHEVALALWVSLGHLADPASATEHLHALEGGTSLRFPAIGFQDHVIWGITHRIIAQFLDIARYGREQGREP